PLLRPNHLPCPCATALPTKLSTLSLHDALPIYLLRQHRPSRAHLAPEGVTPGRNPQPEATRGATFDHRTTVAEAPAEQPPASEPDRKSTRLNSSHVKISYAVFCLKKKNTTTLRT